MKTDNLLSRRIALGRFGAIALSAVAIPTLMTATKASAHYAEKNEKREGAGHEKSEGTEMAENDDDAGAVKAPSAASVAPVGDDKKKKHMKK